MSELEGVWQGGPDVLAAKGVEAARSLAEYCSKSGADAAVVYEMVVYWAEQISRMVEDHSQDLLRDHHGPHPAAEVSLMDQQIVQVSLRFSSLDYWVPHIDAEPELAGNVLLWSERSDEARKYLMQSLMNVLSNGMSSPIRCNAWCLALITILDTPLLTQVSKDLIIWLTDQISRFDQSPDELRYIILFLRPELLEKCATLVRLMKPTFETPFKRLIDALVDDYKPFRRWLFCRLCSTSKRLVSTTLAMYILMGEDGSAHHPLSEDHPSKADTLSQTGDDCRPSKDSGISSTGAVSESDLGCSPSSSSMNLQRLITGLRFCMKQSNELFLRDYTSSAFELGHLLLNEVINICETLRKFLPEPCFRMIDTILARMYCNQASIYLSLQRLDEALFAANHALSLNRNCRQAHRVRADIHMRRADFNTALDDLEEILNQDNDHPYASAARREIQDAFPSSDFYVEEVGPTTNYSTGEQVLSTLGETKGASHSGRTASGVSPIKNDNLAPCARERHTASTYGHSQLIVFGGIRYGAKMTAAKSSLSSALDRPLNDLWAFETRDRFWKRIKSGGLNPCNRHSHSADIIGSHLYVIGGADRIDCGESDCWSTTKIVRVSKKRKRKQDMYLALRGIIGSDGVFSRNSSLSESDFADPTEFIAAAKTESLAKGAKTVYFNDSSGSRIIRLESQSPLCGLVRLSSDSESTKMSSRVSKSSPMIRESNSDSRSESDDGNIRVYAVVDDESDDDRYTRSVSSTQPTSMFERVCRWFEGYNAPSSFDSASSHRSDSIPAALTKARSEKERKRRLRESSERAASVASRSAAARHSSPSSSLSKVSKSGTTIRDSSVLRDHLSALPRQFESQKMDVSRKHEFITEYFNSEWHMAMSILEVCQGSWHSSLKGHPSANQRGSGTSNDESDASEDDDDEDDDEDDSTLSVDSDEFSECDDSFSDDCSIMAGVSAASNAGVLSKACMASVQECHKYRKDFPLLEVFDLKNKRWIRPKTVGNPPQSYMMKHRTVVVGRRIFVFPTVSSFPYMYYTLPMHDREPRTEEDVSMTDGDFRFVYRMKLKQRLPVMFGYVFHTDSMHWTPFIIPKSHRSFVTSDLVVPVGGTYDKISFVAPFSRDKQVHCVLFTRSMKWSPLRNIPATQLRGYDRMLHYAHTIFKSHVIVHGGILQRDPFSNPRRYLNARSFLDTPTPSLLGYNTLVRSSDPHSSDPSTGVRRSKSSAHISLGLQSVLSRVLSKTGLLKKKASPLSDDTGTNSERSSITNAAFVRDSLSQTMLDDYKSEFPATLKGLPSESVFQEFEQALEAEFGSAEDSLSDEQQIRAGIARMLIAAEDGDEREGMVSEEGAVWERKLGPLWPCDRPGRASSANRADSHVSQLHALLQNNYIPSEGELYTVKNEWSERQKGNMDELCPVMDGLITDRDSRKFAKELRCLRSSDLDSDAYQGYASLFVSNLEFFDAIRMKWLPRPTLVLHLAEQERLLQREADELAAKSKTDACGARVSVNSKYSSNDRVRIDGGLNLSINADFQEYVLHSPRIHHTVSVVGVDLIVFGGCATQHAVIIPNFVAKLSRMSMEWNTELVEMKPKQSTVKRDGGELVKSDYESSVSSLLLHEFGTDWSETSSQDEWQVSSANDALHMAQCANCLILELRQLNFRTCSQCKMVQYCSRDCQRQHWKMEHRHRCQKLSQTKPHS